MEQVYFWAVFSPLPKMPPFQIMICINNFDKLPTEQSSQQIVQ